MKKQDSKIKQTTEAAETTAAKTPEVTGKKKKEEKKISSKKLPGILKKNYTRKKLNKLLKRIYIPTDRELVESQFVPNPKKEGKFYIPGDIEFPKSKFDKLKKIGKDVASQKFAIKIVPLAAVVGFIAAVIILVCTFKNVLARKVLTNAMQGAFGAKTDIEYVNVEILGSSISIKGLAQGYKEDPWKNLFELKEVTIDFNLTELLRGKFDLENIAVEGVNVMTPRNTSAELPKPTKVKQKSAAQIALENKAQVAEEAAKEELEKLFIEYSPENILKNIESQLSTPAIAKEVYETSDALVKKWMTKPEEVSKEVTAFSDKVNTLVNTDWSKVNDVAKIKDAIELISTSINDGKKLANETKVIVNDVKKDSAQIKKEAVKVSDAVKKDSDYAKNEVNKIKSFTMKDGARLLTGPIDTILYKTIGKYYPYIKQGIGLAMQAKNSSSANAKENIKKTEKSPAHQRLAGINVYYRKDNVPKFLIERMSCSGVNWSGLATNISSDMDKRGQPAFAEAKMEIAGQNHNGDLTVDTRSETKNPLIALNYSGDKYPIEFAVPQFGVTSLSAIKGHGEAKTDGSFTVGADLNLKNLKFETEKFEPEFAYTLYNRALSYFTEMSLGVEFVFDKNDDFSMNLSTDADKKFAEILKKLVNEEIDNLKTEALKQINSLLNNLSKDADIKINEFIDIENGINAESIKLNKLNSRLEEKKKELTAQLAAESKKAIGNSIGGQSAEKIDNVLGGLNNLLKK